MLDSAAGSQGAVAEIPFPPIAGGRAGGGEGGGVAGATANRVARRHGEECVYGCADVHRGGSRCLAATGGGDRYADGIATGVIIGEGWGGGSGGTFVGAGRRPAVGACRVHGVERDGGID